MSGQYMQLSNLRDDADGNAEPYQRMRKGAGWSVRKRWIVVGTLVSVLLIIFMLGGSRPRSRFRTPSDGTSHDKQYSPELPIHITPTTALLGPNEDATRLWFPPIGSSFSPTVASYNLSPSPRLRTPLFIAFTRNNAMLQQVVLSYIAAGWPREDIIVVDNSGTMDANNQQLLTEDNPFYMDYNIFRRRYGVSILQTPVLLNFAQLMNFFLRTAMAHDWQYFFWSHMDVAVISDEVTSPYKSFHQHVLSILANLNIDSLQLTNDNQAANDSNWAIKYFTYDWLTLVNVPAWRKIGQWDPFIPYYLSDCDAYSRIALNGLTKDDVRAGRIFDLPSTIPNLEEKFFPQPPESQLNSIRYQKLLIELDELTAKKPENNRNKWQGKLHGGKGEPWTYDPEGFQKMWWKTADFGKEVYQEKWGSSECRLDEHGITLADMFKPVGL